MRHAKSMYANITRDAIIKRHINCKRDLERRVDGKSFSRIIYEKIIDPINSILQCRMQLFAQARRM